MKNILITGASGGIGLALSETLISSGMRNLIFQYRSKKEELEKLLEKFDIDTKRMVFCDLTSEAQIELMHKHVKDNFGSTWGIINLAGASSNSMSWKMTKDDFKKIIDNNLVSTFSVCKEFIPEMREQGGGRIINISSVVASTGVPGASHYCAAKAGIEGFTRSIALELANKNITVNTLALGYFEYGLINHLSSQHQDDVKAKTPAKRFGKACEIAGAIKFLVSEEGSFTTGQVIHINGGFHL